MARRRPNATATVALPGAIEQRPIGSLKPRKTNSRTHSEKQIEQLTASFQQWGFTNPILVDEKGSILAGHGRYVAAQKLNLKTVPVIVMRGWTEAQKRAYVMADNQLALNAGWDEELRRAEIQDLNKSGFDLDLIGFSDSTLKKLLDTDVMSATAMLGNDLVYQVVVVAKDETDQAKLLKKFEKEGLECRPLIS